MEGNIVLKNTKGYLKKFRVTEVNVVRQEGK